MRECEKCEYAKEKQESHHPCVALQAMQDKISVKLAEISGPQLCWTSKASTPDLNKTEQGNPITIPKNPKNQLDEEPHWRVACPPRSLKK